MGETNNVYIVLEINLLKNTCDIEKEMARTYKIKSMLVYELHVNGSKNQKRAKRFRVRVMLRLTVSQPVRLGVDPLLGLMTRF
jgi:hypothetical protein